MPYLINMKKLLLLFCLTLFLGGITSHIQAQCYGTVQFDNSVTAGANGFPLFGNSSFDITTSYCNELILISYDGWNGPGIGPVTVNGNPATYVNNATNGNSGTADVYAYQAGAPGTYSIVCSTSGYNRGYYNNFAAAFYVTGSNIPISIGSLTTTINTIVCTTGGSITDNITTAIPGSMIYATCEINEGQTSTYPISWTGATFLGNTHTEDGIDAGDAYTTAATPGTYTITATNSSPPNNGCGGLTIVLVDIPPPLCGGGGVSAIATQNNPSCGNCNGSINIVVNGGSPPFTYTWTPNVSTSASANNLCAGTYTISVNDAACHDTSIVITLPANSLNLVDTLHVNEKCFGNCNGSSQIVVHGGQSPYTYSWAPIVNNTNAANSLCAGNYTVTVQDANGCSNTILVDITQPAALSATTAVTNPICNGGVGKIVSNATGGVSPYTYSWTPSGQTTATATGLSAGTYNLTVTDSNGCTFPTSATITQPNALDVSVSGPSVICIGSSGTLRANVSGGTAPYTNYAWSPGVYPSDSTANVSPVANTTYTVVVTDANGCTASGQISVDLGPTMSVSISGAHSICAGLSTTLCASIDGGTGGNSYTWQPGNLTTPCITVSPNSNTTYSLTVVDNCLTTANATSTLRVNPLPATAFATSLSNGCAPLCIQFYNTTTLSQGNSATYLWTFGDGDSSNTQSPINCYSNSGSYSVSLTVISDSGCSSTLNKVGLITAYPRPAGAFTYSPESPTILNPIVQFTDKSYDPYNIIYWMWNFGDQSDSTSNKENPAHIFQDTGRYCVSMTEMDEHGCADTVTNCIVIAPNFNLYIPSAFSPNGDQKNPTFEPKGQYIKSFEMYIFDRWGMQLYHTTDINKGWDGTVSGGGVEQEDTYVYKIIVTDSEKKQHTYIGNVTLLK